MHRHTSTVLVLLLSLLGSLAARGQTFTRITQGAIVKDAGFSFGHAWADFDNDGDLDLIVNNLTALTQPNLVYRNDGDGVFSRLQESVLSEYGPSTSSSWGDVDNDGDRDLFVANGGTVGAATNFFYVNDGGGQFTRVVAGPLLGPAGIFTVTTWADFDNNGHLDLFVGRSSGNNAIFFNDGAGVFTSSTLLGGSSTWGIAPADFDNDGDLDLYAANYGRTNTFLRNDDGAFTLIAGGPVGGATEKSLGASWADFDNDGDLDLFVSHSGGPNDLYRNDDGVFTEVLETPVTATVHNSEGSCWADFDNDGDLDLLVAGGGNVAIGTNLRYTNDGAGNFSEVTTGELVTLPGRYEALTCVDYDDDGDLDVFLSNWNNRDNVLFANDGTDHHWINIRSVGTVSNRGAVGTRVRVKARIDGEAVWQMRELAGHTGHVAQGSPRVHVGLGDAAVIDSLVIHWPSGRVEVFTDLATDQFLVATEGQTVSPVATQHETPLPEFFGLDQNYPNPFREVTAMSYRLPKAAFVTLTVYDLLGREVAVLVEARQRAGRYAARFDGRGLPSGVYVYVLEAGGVRRVRKLLLMR